MTVKELTKVMGNQFIAVYNTEGKIAYSGSAESFRSYTENYEVKNLVAPERKNSATLIYT